YRELNERANGLAHHLIGLGVGPETVVGIALDRSVEMVVALLGIMKAGGAYLPLDPNYPEARLTFILADAAPGLVLTSSRLRSGLPQTVNVLSLDAAEVQVALGQQPASNPTDAERHASLLPQHSAYVIYTSGSTGQPKGVIVTQAGIHALAST